MLVLLWNQAPAEHGHCVCSLCTGNTSYATVQLQSGPNLYNCNTPVLTGPSATSSGAYRESITCNLPTYLPAANYTLWVNVTGSNTMNYGLGMGQTLTVPLIITSVSPSTSSSAGGVAMTLTGNGFSAIGAEDVTITFDGQPAKVLTTSATTITFVTPAVPSAYNTSRTLPLVITPTRGAVPQQDAAVTVTFDPTSAPTVTGIIPNRGSTEGGTTITIKGSGFTGTATDYTITIGGNLTCGSVTLVNATALTCVTPKPSWPRIGSLPITVTKSGAGNALCGADGLSTQCTYEYLNLWSRRTTWGGNDPPGEGDSIYIPEGRCRAGPSIA